MIRARLWASLAVALGCAGAAAPGAASAGGPTFRMTCDVVRVVDGDTADLRCAEGGIVHRLRLTDVDAPERGEPGFQAATERLRRRLGARAAFVFGGSPDRPRTDSYGRLLGRPAPPPPVHGGYMPESEGARRSRLTP